MIDSLYLPNNYLDMGAVAAAPYPFIVIVSARGAGKTYGILEHVIKNGIKFMYFRRTAAILDIVTDKHLHPFKRLNKNNNWEIYPRTEKGIGYFYDKLNDDRFCGYAGALSTFANIRGFDGSDIDLIIYDEFIPQENERQMFNAFIALSHAHETIGRNRELEGMEPVKTLLLSNSDVIYGDIVAGFDIGGDLLRMQEEGIEQMEKSPDMLLIMPQAEAFREEKAKTALYRVTAGTDFSNVALDNKFKIHDRKNIGSRPLVEYRPIASIYGICIYRHKHNGWYYVSEKVSGAPKEYDANETERRRFLRDNPAIWRAYQRKKIVFENIKVQTVYKNLFE